MYIYLYMSIHIHTCIYIYMYIYNTHQPKNNRTSKLRRPSVKYVTVGICSGETVGVTYVALQLQVQRHV